MSDTKCMHCGEPVGYWAYCSHGERFCSLECVNKTYSLRNDAEERMENAVV